MAVLVAGEEPEAEQSIPRLQKQCENADPDLREFITASIAYLDPDQR